MHSTMTAETPDRDGAKGCPWLWGSVTARTVRIIKRKNVGGMGIVAPTADPHGNSVGASHGTHRTAAHARRWTTRRRASYTPAPPRAAPHVEQRGASSGARAARCGARGVRRAPGPTAGPRPTPRAGRAVSIQPPQRPRTGDPGQLADATRPPHSRVGRLLLRWPRGCPLIELDGRVDEAGQSDDHHEQGYGKPEASGYDPVNTEPGMWFRKPWPRDF